MRNSVDNGRPTNLETTELALLETTQSNTNGSEKVGTPLLFSSSRYAHTLSHSVLNSIMRAGDHFYRDSHVLSLAI